MIEVEIRSFINDEEYSRLKKFFDANAELIKEDEQETHYFDCDADLRIQKARNYSKIWLKKGKIHDEHREEIEIKTDKDNFEELQKLFQALNYSVKIKWFRKRIAYKWNDIIVTLDDTKGYGKIIELEKLADEDNKLIALNELKEKIKELNIEITPREKFEEKFKYYEKNWRSLIKYF